MPQILAMESGLGSMLLNFDSFNYTHQIAAFIVLGYPAVIAAGSKIILGLSLDQTKSNVSLQTPSNPEVFHLIPVECCRFNGTAFEVAGSKTFSFYRQGEFHTNNLNSFKKIQGAAGKQSKYTYPASPLSGMITTSYVKYFALGCLAMIVIFALTGFTDLFYIGFVMGNLQEKLMDMSIFKSIFGSYLTIDAPETNKYLLRWKS